MFSLCPRAVLLLAAIGAAGAIAAAQPAPVATPGKSPALSRPEMEGFLQRGRIVKKRGVSKGITGTWRVTLDDGTLKHDASVQTIDERRAQFQTALGTEINFRDTWQFNVAAYLLDQLLDIGMIPATVARRFDGKDASFTWWVDDVMMDEGERLKKKARPPDIDAWNEQMWIVRVFDQLIYNTDRNLGNLLITSDWRIWMIDHSRAFRWHKTLGEPANLSRCDRRLLEHLRKLDEATLQRELHGFLGDNEISGLLARRDLIVAYFDRAGAAALYDARRPR